MFIKILDDGTIVSYNTEEAREFLSPLGKLETTGESKIKTYLTDKGIQFIFVRDEEGHTCDVCKQKVLCFTEIIDNAKLNRSLRICYECVMHLHVHFGFAIDEFYS